MKKIHRSKYTATKIIGALMLGIVVTAMSCAKDPIVNPDPPINPQPVVSPPSGVIDTFYITDSLVPFNTVGSDMKWLVSGTNNQTLVTINGVKVAFYGVLNTGPLRQTSTFTLAVNNGKRVSRTLQVADSITTNMWNNGKRLKIITREVYLWRQTDSMYKFRDTTSSIDAAKLDQRIYFSYFGTSEAYQKTANKFVALSEGGKFVVHVGTNATTDPSTFMWQGTLYTIVKLDSNFLVVIYYVIQPGGLKLKTQDTYAFE